jgi:hypothetical protein
MNMFKKYFWLTLIIFISSTPAFSEDVKVMSVNGSKLHACLLKDPSNLLISLKKKKFGFVLDFDKETSSVTKTVKKTNTQIKALKGKTDSASNSKRKKLKTSVKNLKFLLISINNCKNKNNTQISVLSSVNCAEQGTLEGTACDDLNPCTGPDKCQAGKCSGSPIASQGSITCSFASCSKAIEQCKDNKITVCVEGAASEEICNKVDDDCNGETDEKGICNAEPTSTAVPTATLSSGPTFSETAVATNTSTPAVTSTSTKTPTITNTPSKTPTKTPTPILFCPDPNNNINLGAAGCACTGSDDCLGICTAGICVSNGNTCPSSGNALAVSPTNCECVSNLDCTPGICRANSDGLCGTGTSNSIGCAKTDNNLRVNFPGCACTDNTDCLSPMTCTTISGSTAKYCTGGGVTCFDDDNTQALNPRNCPCISNAACKSNSCGLAQGAFGSACR